MNVTYQTQQSTWLVTMLGSCVTAVDTIGHELLNMVLPRGCAGCQLPDIVVCNRCVRVFRDRHARVFPSVRMGHSFSCAVYQGPVRTAILSWKDHGDEELTPMFTRLMTELTVDSSVVDWCLEHAVRAVLVVAVPSSPFSMVRRGRMHTMVLARAVARALHERGIDARATSVLHLRLRTPKSVSVSHARGRIHRLSGNIRVRFPRSTHCRNIILVDDIMTTGSTMRACITALMGHRADVITVFSLAATRQYA